MTNNAKILWIHLASGFFFCCLFMTVSVVWNSVQGDTEDCFRVLWAPECCVWRPPLAFLTDLFPTTLSLLEINWVSYLIWEEKKTFIESGKKWLRWVTKDLQIHEALVAHEVRASGVNSRWFPGSQGTVRNHEARPAWTWLVCQQRGLLALPLCPLPTFSSLDLHIRRWHGE